jgi:hypothetical protein
MDRSHFYEAKKTGLAFSDFSMIFDEFCKISIFIEKEKTKERETKACMGLV